MTRIAAALALLTAAAASAQKVELPEKIVVPVGRLAAIEIAHDGDDCRWDVPPNLDAFREYDADPHKIRLRVIGYAAGTHRIVAVCCKGAKLSPIAVCVIHVGQPQPEPVPPEPEPPRPVPPEPVGLAKKAMDWAKSVGSPGKLDETSALAKNFRTAASAQRAGAYQSLAAMSTTLREMNQAAIPSANRAAWRTAFFTPLDAELGATIKTLDGYGAACAAIADGLEAASGKNQ